MAHYGLTSQEAQERLHSQLELVCHNLLKVDWLRELRQPPFTPLVYLATALAGLLLVLDYSLSPDPNGATLFQAIVLLLFSVLNAGLFCWEVYIIKTRSIRRLLSKVKPFLESTCPWTPLSYPSRSINTLRGHFTVLACRDGAAVNLPISLVVQGDVIELYKDIPSPASATLLGSGSVATSTHVEMGEFLPSELFQREERRKNISLVGEEKRLKFVVTQTPVIGVFLNTIRKKRPTSVLTREKNHILAGTNIFIIVALGISFVFNLIRFTALPNDVGPWTEMLLRLQVYTVLPLLQLPLPLVWATMNLYGTARVVLLAEEGPNFAKRGNFRRQLKVAWDVFKQMVHLVFSPSMYPNYRVFHILGSLTSLCSVDKEFVLTDGAPVPEKVFFLSRRRSPEEDDPLRSMGGGGVEKQKRVEIIEESEAEFQEAGELGRVVMGREGWGMERGRGPAKENGNQREEARRPDHTPEVKFLTETNSVDGSLSLKPVRVKVQSSLELERTDEPPAGDLVRADSDPSVLSSTVHNSSIPRTVLHIDACSDRDKKKREHSHHATDKPVLRPLRLLSEESTTVSESSPVLRLQIEGTASLPHRLSQALSSSALSLTTPFELVTEILDLSPSTYSTQSGLCFDDINWENYLGSLKPIGVNSLATSHLLRDPYAWSPSGCSEYVRSNLCKTNCVCPLGIEIGVTEYSQGNFTNEVLFFSISDPSQNEENKVSSVRRPSTSLLTEHAIQPHLLSSVLKDGSSGNYLVMSRGSGDMVAACCSDFWDGKDLQPMTNIERGEIEAFYARRHLTSYCVALAYNPLLDTDLSPFQKRNLALYIPKECINASFENVGYLYSTDELHSQPVTSYSGEQLFSSLLCNQVFLGVVSLQFQPKADIVSLIEDLESAGIRFVYFTNENEVRGKVFAEKLGLEAGWNCHISLSPGSEDEGISNPRDEHDFDSCSTSTSSSLNSVINAFQSYIRAKLPKGIRNVRPHLENMDNVPLLVPLFTDCTVDAIREMIEIMQENGEVVMCLGNAWNQDNLSIFAQADVSLSIIPECTNLQCCPETTKDDGTLSTSISDKNFGNPPQQTDPNRPIWPTPLEMASYLNTAICQLCIHSQSDISILTIVTDSRRTVSCIRHGLLFGLGSCLSLVVLMLAATIFFLPPPLSGGHIFWLLLFVFPILTLSSLSSTFDLKIKTQMPSRKKKILKEKFLYLGHFCMTFLPTALFSLVLFTITLSSFCSENTPQNISDCHPLLGDRNESSSWNGWRGRGEQGLWLAQDFTALFFTLYLIAHSIRFVHRTAPIWRLYRYTSWPYIAVASLVIVLQIVYFAASQTATSSVYHLAASVSLSSIPPYVWVLGLSWCLPLVLFHELLKYQDRKLVVKLQRHLKLEFETKLGMNSPF